MRLTVEDAKKLHQKKYREQFSRYLVEGEHLVLELQKAAEQNPLLSTSQVFVSEHYKHWQSNFPVTVVGEKAMSQLSDTKSPQGIIAVAPLVTAEKKSMASKAIYLHEIQDPGNLGTILRSLAWFGQFELLLSPDSVDPFNGKVVRASMGAIFHVPMELNVSLADLSQRFTRIGCLDMQGEALQHPSLQTCECFIFGNEARGVPQQALSEFSVNRYTIVGSGMIESLNLGSAVTLCAYELTR